MNFSDTEDILLASGAKDGFIRIWKLSSKIVTKTEIISNEKDYELSLNPLIVEVTDLDDNKKTIQCTLDSVLKSHDGMVSDLYWHQHLGEFTYFLCFISFTLKFALLIIERA